MHSRLFPLSYRNCFSLFLPNYTRLFLFPFVASFLFETPFSLFPSPIAFTYHYLLPIRSRSPLNSFLFHSLPLPSTRFSHHSRIPLSFSVQLLSLLTTFSPIAFAPLNSFSLPLPSTRYSLVSPSTGCLLSLFSPIIPSPHSFPLPFTRPFLSLQLHSFLTLIFHCTRSPFLSLQLILTLSPS
jgi:hypothetical protein